MSQKPPTAARDRAYLAAIHDLPCAVCDAFGQVQTSRTEAHHTICGRYSQAKTPDRQAIPLCQEHHQGLDFITSDKLAIHKGKESWVAAYGPDTDYIATTQDKILGMEREEND